MSRTKSLVAVIGSCLTTLALVGFITTTASSSTASSTASAPTTTIRFDDRTRDIRDLEMDVYVSAGVDRWQGKLVGYSTARYVTGDDGFSALAGTFALRDGTIHFRAKYSQNREKASFGRVTGGTGSYAAARGDITLRPISNDTFRVSITIHH